MEKIIFNDYKTLADIMLKSADAGNTTYVVCFFENAVKLLKELMSFKETTIGGIEIAEENYRGYSKEYYISLGDDYIIDVQPAYDKNLKDGKGAYYMFEAEKVFIDGDANSAIIKNIDKNICYEIEFNTDETGNSYDILDMLLENTKIIKNSEEKLAGIGIDTIALLSILCRN